MIDIHSHVLPGVDDGAKNLSETCSMLNTLKTQGFDSVVATPHINLCREKVEEKHRKITERYNEVRSAIDGKNLPELYLGYEVEYFAGISNFEDIRNYTIAGTDYILIELPFSGKIAPSVVDEIYELKFKHNLIPIFAHLERYAKAKGIKYVYDLIYSGDARAQISADAVMHHGSFKAACKLIEARFVYYVGSDAHSPDKRPPRFDRFFPAVEKKYGKGFISFLEKYSEDFKNRIVK